MKISKSESDLLKTLDLKKEHNLIRNNKSELSINMRKVVSIAYKTKLLKLQKELTIELELNKLELNKCG